MWKAIIKLREETMQGMDCTRKYAIIWKGSDTGGSMWNFLYSMDPQGQVKQFVEGIWSQNPTKYSSVKVEIGATVVI